MNPAKNGDTVRVHYRITTMGGDTVDLSPDDEPLELVLGVGRYLPGFEAAIGGMVPGERKSVVIPPEGAFGHHIGDLVQEVGMDLFPPDDPPGPGRRYTFNSAGRSMGLVVAAVDGDRVVLDGNHPLAGESLRAEILLLEILP